MAKLAFMTTGYLLKALDDPHNASYGMLSNKVFEEFGLDEGFLGFGVLDLHDTWGAWAVPKMYQGDEYKGRVLQTMSLWRDLESLFAYSYHGVHAEALKKRDEWFPRLSIPNHVAWWIDDAHQPTWAEGSALYDKIAKEGSQPDAFNLRKPFDVEGNAIKPDREIIKKKAALYKK